MDGGDFLKATFEFNLANASNPCVMVWDWQLDELNDPIDLTISGADIVEAMIARCYTPFAGRLSNQLTMTSVSLRNYADLTDGYDRSGVLFVGTDPTAMLPPFVTFSVELLKGNFTMRSGRKAYPGPTITSLDADGLVTEAAQEAFTAVTDVWADESLFVEGMPDMTFYPRIVRKPLTPGINPSVFSNIIGYGLVKFGSQNTRK